MCATHGNSRLTELVVWHYVGNPLDLLKHYPLYWGVFITLLPIGILCAKRPYLARAYQFLLAYLIGKFLVDLLMLSIAASGKNTIWLYNTLVPFRYLLVSQVFRQFIESDRIRIWINRSVPFFVALSLFDIYFSNIRSPSLNEHLSIRYGGIVECILMLLWILFYFYEVFQSLRIVNLLKSPPFLIAVAWLLFYASLVFYAPLFYYIHRLGSTFHLGFFEFIPDVMELVVILIITSAVRLLPARQHD
jgi:hypothetical protein